MPKQGPDIARGEQASVVEVVGQPARPQRVARQDHLVSARIPDGKGEVAQCEQVLRGYWFEFLRRYVPVDEGLPLEVANVDRAKPAGAPTPAPDDSGTSPSWLKKMVPKPPKLPTWFR